MFVHFWLARKYFRRVKKYELGPELCALFEYGLRNFLSFFVREKWNNLWKVKKISFNRTLSAEVSGEYVYLFWPAWKQFRRAKNYRSQREFCALFERPDKLFLMVHQHVFIYPISPFSNMLKIVGVGRFLEQTLLYKMWYWTER